MGIRDCLQSAVDQGALNGEEAGDLLRSFEDLYAQYRMGLGDDAAAAAAKAAIEKTLRAEAAEARRVLALTQAATRRVDEYLKGFRNPKGEADVFVAALNLIENYGYSGTQSVAGHAKAIISLAHGELADVLAAFRKSRLTGRHMNRPMMDDVVRELHGQASGSPEAKAMADALGGVFESLRQRFNAAGGSIAKLDGWGMPQSHDAAALLAAGRDQWMDFVRPLLDRERMRDPLTGDRLTEARLDQVLRAAWGAVATDGMSKVEPSSVPRGRGSLASQRQEHRVLVFRDADAWLKYDREFGSGDPLRSAFNHINSMANDIAAMEVLGPNPGAMIERIKQIVQKEAANAIEGKPSLYRGEEGAKIADQLRYIPWRLDAVWNYVRGREVVSSRTAQGVSSVRNVITSAVLGGASVLAAATDPFIDTAARYLSGMPVGSAITAIGKTFSSATREQAVRAGIIADDFLHIMGDHARFAGTLGGAEWSKWLAERTMVLSALEPMTQARKHVFALEFMGLVRDQAGNTWDDLAKTNPYLKRTLEGYGLDRTDWDVIRSTDVHRSRPDDAGIIRPIDIAARAEGPGLAKVQRLLGLDDGEEAAAQARAGVTRTAEKLLEVILQQTERAVPSGTARARSFITGGAARGTVAGEMLESALQFKSFGLSFTMLQAQAIMNEMHIGKARGAAYAGALAFGVTIGGAVAMQIRHVLQGKDPQPVDDPKFWMQALQTGGGFGIMGDFLFADVNRFGHSLGETLLGPTIGLASDAFKLTGGNLQQLIQGKDTKAGREAVQFGARYTPVLSSLWYTRAAYRRVFLDQLQFALDPEAHRAFSDQAQRMRRETRQEFWWPPGETAPRRAPEPQNVFPQLLR